MYLLKNPTLEHGSTKCAAEAPAHTAIDDQFDSDYADTIKICKNSEHLSGSSNKKG